MLLSVYLVDILLQAARLREVLRSARAVISNVVSDCITWLPVATHWRIHAGGGLVRLRKGTRCVRDAH
jgi:hypothetical protein